MLFSISELQKETLKQFNCFVILFYIRVINTATQVSSIGTSPKKKKKKGKEKITWSLRIVSWELGLPISFATGESHFVAKNCSCKKN